MTKQTLRKGGEKLPNEIEAHISSEACQVAGIRALLLHLQQSLEVGTLSPRFVDKLLRKVREEAKHELEIDKANVAFLELRILLDDLSYLVIQKKAEVLSSVMADLRAQD